jgi:hypothetical protein
MFALVHLLKQIRPPVLSGAVIATLRRQLLGKGQEPETVLSHPIPEKILSDLHRRVLEFQAALRRASLQLPQDNARFRSETEWLIMFSVKGFFSLTLGSLNSSFINTPKTHKIKDQNAYENVNRLSPLTEED